jgi:predicted transcriptional regulator
MSRVKEEAIKMIQSLPEDTSFKDILYHLYVREKVEEGLHAIDEGRVMTQEEAERRVAERVKSFGQSPL